MNGAQSIRIDRLLVYLRFARTRSAADALIATRAVRCNRQHVLRGAQGVKAGDVLTLATGGGVRVVELIALPRRRGSPAEAATHYREVDGTGLDPRGQNTIGASAPAPGVLSGDPEDLS
ncbi:S4 domain-containing protein [Porphyrobacter sp. AAP82]|uniref:S4 domain-containing protein n=1 Tax=Porphyrobacter sp. AAP82 TaxID=1248917 RepID=UPI0002E241D3|nr:S4 domain-containing protein [Porphyrobacter sp. AAP82]